MLHAAIAQQIEPILFFMIPNWNRLLHHIALEGQDGVQRLLLGRERDRNGAEDITLGLGWHWNQLSKSLLNRLLHLVGMA